MTEISQRILITMQERNISYGDLAAETDIPKSALQRYATGETEKIPLNRLEKIADALHVETAWLLGWDDKPRVASFQSLNRKVIPAGFDPLPETEPVPLVGAIACGIPILAEENVEAYVNVPKGKGIDFCLTCEGDSMEDLGIFDGDVVFIRQQAKVENGEIAAVRIGEEATLKRFYFTGDSVMLMPANAKYAPLVFHGEEINEIHIEGKAVGFTHWFS